MSELEGSFMEAPLTAEKAENSDLNKNM